MPSELKAPAPGEMLGHYRILDKIGAGGMGDVYRATDQNLDREVAIKLLPEEWARDSERLARFAREARLLAALNHPNVATVHGYEELSDRPVLVMELVSGETLRDRMGGNPMPIDEIVALFTQIGAGLEAAHEKGIVHRDLKPANVMVTPAGHVTILDFGLARTVSSERVGAGVSEAPTLAPEMTRSGVVLGTPAYLSPEQARGRAVDRRADLWAFGCMLFEALSGRQAFGCATVSDTIVAVLERDPDLDLLPPETPATMRALVRRCLQKSPEQRQRDAGDAALALMEALSEPLDAASRRKARRSPMGVIALFFLGVLGVLGSILGWNIRPKPPRSPSLVAALTLDEPLVGVDSPVFSPNGTEIIYVARSDTGRTQLRRRRLDQVHSSSDLRHRRREISILFTRRSLDRLFHRRRLADRSCKRRSGQGGVERHHGLWR